jgi:hypothetical protein
VAKKNFSNGLGSIFDANDAQNEAAIVGNEADEMPIRAARRTTKNFTSDLDSLFQDALTEAIDTKKTAFSSDQNALDDAKNRYRKPLSGLDALIRQTSDASLTEMELAPVKRITLMFDNAKVEKLKNIARRERSYMRDIVQNVVADFIENYERKKGAIN